MATVVNNPPPSTGSDSGSGMGMIIGIIVVILVLILLVLFGLPALRNGAATPLAPDEGGGNDAGVTIPDEIDVDVNPAPVE
ncbi:MAG: hypothetical protein WEA04_03770 [Candidatus Andersenbacteria bacterium]